MLQRRNIEQPPARDAARPFPAGVRVLMPDDAERRREIEGSIVRILSGAAYREVILPILDYADCYAALATVAHSRDSYRLVDRAGELLALRSDFTPMVARALAPRAADPAVPRRIFYRGDVVRCESPRLGGGREYFQIGAELLGETEAAADAEIARLAILAVKESGRTVTISCGDASLPSLVENAPGAASVRAKLGGGILDVADLRGIDATAALAARLDRVAAAAEDAGARVVVTFDPEDAAGYYSGLRFRVYAEGLASPVAKGGRYDDLYSRFGESTPAVGFTLNVDALEVLR
jgi:ATP phosphoribosyltransferase regulatory subunit